jgi:uncharacterized protein YcaQ
MTSIAVETARRIALGAQGLARPHGSGRRDRRHFRRVFRDIGLLQLDSVNVLSRSHYLPVFARLGPYPRAALDDYTSHSGEVFEYWGHAASLLPASLYPVLHWRRTEYRPWGRIRELQSDGYVDAVYAEIERHGPITGTQLSDPGSRTGPWWGHGKGRAALDWLFATGRITAFRDHRFGRVYDLPERVIGAEYLDAEPVPKDEAHRMLLDLAARHHGIGTAADLADYYRLNIREARPILHAMAQRGELHEVDVAGWRNPAYLHPEARRPHRIVGSALLSPFDPLVWERSRTERLFGFAYRIEIYVPEPDRIHGYYVLPFLLDGELVGRVDLKAHRNQGRLEVRGAFIERGHQAEVVAASLSEELRTMADWLGLGDVDVVDNGDLAPALADALD